MNWTKIKPYGESDAWTTWISGIYKTQTYDGIHFHAYYIRDSDRNWGWNPSEPPNRPDHYHSPFWPSLESAQNACEQHAKTHTPKKATVTRAAEVQAELIAEQVAAA